MRDPHGNRGRSVRAPVPAAAVLRIVDRWLDEQELPTEPNGCDAPQATPLQQLAWRMNAAFSTTYRAVWRLRHEVEHVTRRTADTFVTATYGPHLWDTDPELSQVPTLRPPAPPDDPLLTDDEIGQWAIQAWGTMTTAERAALRELKPSDPDESRYAKHRERKRA